MSPSKPKPSIALVSEDRAPEAEQNGAGVIEYGRSLLALEAEAVLALSKAIDGSFARAVEIILKLPPSAHVIVSGMGKAGFVGMKISATLASIGVPSFFLNPAEAVHGDLGRYTRDDLALILSNSGETDEVLRIMPAIKRMRCPIVSITGRPSSTLAKYSDLVLDIGQISEAGPLGLAPTTSTTVMLALGDALAMAVLKARGFSKEQFALYHPGGNLGRGLVPISDIMRTGDEHCIVREDMSARDVIHQICCTKRRPGAASIIDSSGKLTGCFTDGNLRRCLDSREDFLDLPILRVMSRNPKTIRENQIASEALRLLSECQIDQVIVVDALERPIGMVDIQDLIEVRSAPPPAQM
jgi:arabinose-5-phosphate isomerase